MRRRHTVEFYGEIVEQIRKKVPNASLTSDFIVGYPGETEEQFMNTVEAVKKFGFDISNTAAYSPRPRTPAAMFDNQISEEEKKRRLNYLNQVVREVSLIQNRKHLGVVEEVLVEAYNPKYDNLKGRTRTHKILHFAGQERLIGQIMPVKVLDVTPNSLRGRLVVA